MNNKFIDYIKSNCIDNKYTKWYINIISNGKLRPISREACLSTLGYVESHHIVPKCICKDKDDIINSDNLVFLTFREHLICHLLLCKMFNDINIKIRLQHACNAFNILSNEQTLEKIKINSKILELMRIEYVRGLSIRYSGSSNPFYGKKHHEDTLVKMRKPKQNSDNMGRYIRTQEIKDKMSSNRTGKAIGKDNAMNDPINRDKVSKSKIGRKLAINPITKCRKYVFPDNIPDGFILK